MPENFPGLPPYLDDAFERRGLPAEFAGQVKKSWAVKQVGRAISSLDQLAADPEVVPKSIADVLTRSVQIVEAETAGIEAVTTALRERVDALGLDSTPLEGLSLSRIQVEADRAKKALKKAVAQAKADVESALRERDAARKELDAAKAALAAGKPKADETVRTSESAP